MTAREEGGARGRAPSARAEARELHGLRCEPVEKRRLYDGGATEARVLEAQVVRHVHDDVWLLADPGGEPTRGVAGIGSCGHIGSARGIQQRGGRERDALRSMLLPAAARHGGDSPQHFYVADSPQSPRKQRTQAHPFACQTQREVSSGHPKLTR